MGKAKKTKTRTIALRKEHPIDAAKRLAEVVGKRADEALTENDRLRKFNALVAERCGDLAVCLDEVLRMVKRVGGFMSAEDQEVCRVARYVLDGRTLAQIEAEAR